MPLGTAENMRKTKFFREPDNLAGNLETWKFFQETQSNDIKISGILRFWGAFLLNIQDDIPDFREGFYLHVVPLKQHLLGLSLPVIFAR